MKMYFRRANGPLRGRTSEQQLLALLHAIDDFTNLGISNLGISATSDEEELQKLRGFIDENMELEIQKEIAKSKAKSEKSTQAFYNHIHFKEWVYQWVPQRIDEKFQRKITQLGFEEASETTSLKEWQSRIGSRWVVLAAMPEPPLMTMTPREAEFYCSHLMLFYGAKGSQTTQYSQDGGIDVVSDNFVAQVKHQESPVGVKVVRETFGVSSQEKKLAIVFAKTGFTNDAISFATQNGVLLISYVRGPTSWTVATNKALKNGLMSVLPDAKSVQPAIDTERAISWKNIYTEANRDSLDSEPFDYEGF
jgi:hypothetical protein